MNRRHFIQLSGASLGSLLLTGWKDFNPTGERIQLPIALSITLDDGIHPLTTTDHTTWTYRQCTVQLLYQGNALQVTVQSPGMALHQVALQWHYPAAPGSVMVGDHWERTYGDLAFHPPVFATKLPWYFIEHHQQTTTCFGVQTGARSICYWQAGDGKLQLTLDTRNGGSGVLLGNRVLHAANIVTTKNQAGENTFATAHRFCKTMCPSPRLPAQPVYGINDWYFAYGNSSAELILQHTTLLAGLATNTGNRPYSVVDAGWAKYSPLLPGDCCWQDDLAQPNSKFHDMQALAGNIQQLGMRPGLWTRPLCGSHNDAHNLLLPSIPGRDDPKKPVLDPTIEVNLERVKNLLTTYRQWGFEMVKHDFSTYDLFGRWGFEMNEQFTASGWRFNNPTLTNAEVVLQLYTAIREAAGNTCLIGCNTIGHLSAGLFELNRIGDDTSGNEWDRTRKMGVNTMGFRLVQHQAFFSADGDCVGLTNKVPWEKNKQWMQLLAASSAPLFISAQPDALGAEQKQWIRQSFEQAARSLPLAEPLDWLTQQWPARWKLEGKTTIFNWG